MEANLNERVWVQLTKDGEKALAKYYDDLKIPGDLRRPPKQHFLSGTWYTYSIWEWAQIFGPAMYNGGPVLFIDNRVRFAPPV